tara:strand:+ start:503 stop:685 length:183 start_codon:yes stop_codon:yes gene_type:complete
METIGDFIISSLTGDDGKVTYIVHDAYDSYGNATPRGGRVRETFDTREKAIEYIDICRSW